MVAVYKFPECGVEIMISFEAECESTGPGVRIRHRYAWNVIKAGRFESRGEYFPDGCVCLVEEALAEGENALLKAMEADPCVRNRVFAAAPALRALLEKQDIAVDIADVPTSTKPSLPPL